MRAMCASFKGKIEIKKSALNLDLTLLGGQSFRWIKQQNAFDVQPEWRGVAYNAFWILTQTDDAVFYTAHTSEVFANQNKCDSNYFNDVLGRYFRKDFDLPKHIEEWKEAHQHFQEIVPHLKSVRVLDQEPLENILSFMCSQNNNIKRISTMVQWLCTNYGELIGKFNDKDEYTFPTLQSILKNKDELENKLREAKFGYRAKFIAQTVEKLQDNGGEKWFTYLRNLPYEEAHSQLMQLPGVGAKVADCICLMSLNQLEAVPVDTHIFKVAQTSYMPELAQVKAVTPKLYVEISKNFRKVYGPYAGWAQTVLFCSQLQQFNATETSTGEATTKRANKRKK